MIPPPLGYNFPYIHIVKVCKGDMERMRERRRRIDRDKGVKGKERGRLV